MTRPKKWHNPKLLTILVDESTVELIDTLRAKAKARGLTFSRGELVIKALTLYQKWGTSDDVQ